MRTPSRFGAAWLVWRFISASLGASITVATVVFAVAAGATAVPRAVDNVLTSGLRHDLRVLPPTRRDIVSREIGQVAPGPSSQPDSNTLSAADDAVWGTFDDALQRFRNELPADVRRHFGPPQFTVTMLAAPCHPVDQSQPDPNSQIILGVDPRIADRVRVVDGSRPGPIPVADAKDGVSDKALFATPIDIMVSAEAATKMQWPIGQLRTLTPTNIPPLTLRLSGTYEARDRHDPYWQQTGSALKPTVIDEGLSTLTSAVGWIDPVSYPKVEAIAYGSNVHSWFPLKTDGLTSANSAGFATALRSFGRIGHQIDPTSDDQQQGYVSSQNTIASVAFSSGSADAIQRHSVTATTTLAMTAMTLSGPIGVVLAVIVLGVGLVRERRTAGLDIAAARGASSRQLRTILAVEGALIGLPAAALGLVAGRLAVPGRVDTSAILVALLIGLVPAGLLATSKVPAGTRRARSDLNLPARQRGRRLTEIIVIAAAGTAVLLLHRRGFAGSTDGRRVDPLMAATPLLLTLAACIVVLRLYPLWVAWLLRIMRRRRGMTGLLGAARALRDPAAGLAAILAVVAGLSLAVFSGVALTTIENGVDDSARTSVGADASLRAGSLVADQVDRIRTLPGIRKVAPVYDDLNVQLDVDGNRSYVLALVVDAKELRAVQAGADGALDIPPSFSADGSDQLPIIASASLAERIGAADRTTADRHTLRLVGTAPDVGPFTDRSAWFLVDRSNATKVLGAGYSAKRLLLDLDGTAITAATRGEIARIAGADSSIETPVERAHTLRENPVIPGLTRTLVGATIAVTALASIAIVMTVVRAGPARRRLFSIARILGFTRRQSRGLVAWEIGPLVAVALVMGCLLGFALPYAVLAGVDLRQFTGGSVQPDVSIDPVLTTLIAASVLGVVVLAGALTIVLLRRTDQAQELRMMED